MPYIWPPLDFKILKRRKVKRLKFFLIHKSEISPVGSNLKCFTAGQVVTSSLSNFINITFENYCDHKTGCNVKRLNTWYCLFQMDMVSVCSAAGVFSLISSGEPFTPDGIIVAWFHPSWYLNSFHRTIIFNSLESSLSLISCFPSFYLTFLPLQSTVSMAFSKGFPPPSRWTVSLNLNQLMILILKCYHMTWWILVQCVMKT